MQKVSFGSLKEGYISKLNSRKSKHKYLWQQDAETVSAYFGASLYWLFHKFHPDEIMAEYKWFKEKGDKDKGHFIAMLGWKKKKQQG